MRTLGIDGGGTSTKAVVLDDGETTWLPPGPPVNGLVDRGLAIRIAGLVAQTRVDAVGVGLAGVRALDVAQRLKEEIETLTGGVIAEVTDDAGAALWGAIGDRPGAVLIAGTGSVAVGRSTSGQIARLGGHGYLLGDEGSGYWIGRELLRLALRAMTRVDPLDSVLIDFVGERFGAHPDAIEQAVYSAPTTRSRIAALAGASQGVDSRVVRRVHHAAAEHLIQLGQAIRVLAPTGDLVLVGGLWGLDSIRQNVQAHLEARTGGRSPAEGAALQARRTLADSRNEPDAETRAEERRRPSTGPCGTIHGVPQ